MRVEWKYQHFLNVYRSLLYQAKLPSSYWYYSIMYTTFITNKVTTKILRNQSPYQKQYEKNLDIDSFKVFGSLCYAYSQNINITDLIPKQEKKFYWLYHWNERLFYTAYWYQENIYFKKCVISWTHIVLQCSNTMLYLFMDILSTKFLPWSHKNYHITN